MPIETPNTPPRTATDADRDANAPTRTSTDADRDTNTPTRTATDADRHTNSFSFTIIVDAGDWDEGETTDLGTRM